ncbi:MAG TPA: hypothetical protein VD973_04785 [Symbiobacteriaceae bacterium]|nr:hypothetical protein [Symbiobacteriaceae bacterium]
MADNRDKTRNGQGDGLDIADIGALVGGGAAAAAFTSIAGPLTTAPGALTGGTMDDEATEVARASRSVLGNKGVGNANRTMGGVKRTKE